MILSNIHEQDDRLSNSMIWKLNELFSRNSGFNLDLVLLLLISTSFVASRIDRIEALFHNGN